MKKLLVTLTLFITAYFATAQGVTYSSIGGRVLDDQGMPLMGSNIVVKHIPSGSIYGVITDEEGYFRASGLRPGGPYLVEISYTGFETFKQENVYLQLGQTERFNPTLTSNITALEEIVVTDTGFNSNRTGNEVYVDREKIDALPQVTRSLADYVRTTPFAQIQEGNDGFAISIAGQNNRYNTIYIDGAVNNDVFGLAGSGTNGGQTGVNPISIDAIESFQVQVSPFDVKIGGFAGGAVNAVTRSGSNELEASVYYYSKNENLAGKDSWGNGEKLPEFSNQLVGVRVGGAIVPNKLFYFVNYERQDDETPNPWDASGYTGDLGPSGIQSFGQQVQAAYGFDPGTLSPNPTILESEKINIKLDWNAGENDKLSLAFRYLDAYNIEARRSSDFGARFYNGSEEFSSKTTNLTFNWVHQTSKLNNTMNVSVNTVRDDRDPSGDIRFPTVNIDDGQASIQLGAEAFSTANLLNQDVITITNNLELYSGKHTFTIGTHNEFYSSTNLFIRQNYGQYEYLNPQGFLNSDPDALDIYFRSYSLLTDELGDDALDSAAITDYAQIGFYVQDDYQVSSDFKLTAGLRLDIPFWSDRNPNPDFNSRTIPLLEAAGKNLRGASVEGSIDTRLYLSPRAGFNWDINGDKKTVLRGGIGVFLSRMPIVWNAGSYNNTGVTVGGDVQFGIPFEPNIENQPQNVAAGSGGTSGQIDLFVPDFKMPQRLKYALGFDKVLDSGWKFSFDGLFTDNLQGFAYENLNIGNAVGRLNGADNRPYYNRRATLDPTYDRIPLVYNTTEGYSYNLGLQIAKNFNNGFDFSATYSFGDAFILYDQTSSQNSSNWRGQPTVNGKNAPKSVGRSLFSQGHRVIANLSYEINWNNNLRTQIGLFYSGTEGQPYSYTYRDGADLLNDDSRDNALIYVPASQSEITLEDPSNWSALNSFIENNDYLSERRGDYVEKNATRGPWTDIVDLRFVQDLIVSKNKLQFTFDIFNFTNFINQDWGRRYFVGSFGFAQPLRTVTAGPDPVFRFQEGSDDPRITDFGFSGSRWRAQIGIRYTFK